MSEARTWLPASAVADGRSAARVERDVRAWLERWFADAGLHDAAITGPGAMPDGASKALVPLLEGVAIRWSADTAVRWGRAALGHQAKGGLSRPDGEILAKLGTRMREELSTILAGSLGAAPAASGDVPKRGGRVWHLAAGRNGASPLVELWIGEERMTWLRRSLCGPAAPPPLRAVEIGRAAAECEAEFTVRLGSARVSVSELRDLAPGDLLVLDRSLDEPVRLEAAAGGCLLLADLVGDEVSMQLKAR